MNFYLIFRYTKNLYVFKIYNYIRNYKLYIKIKGENMAIDKKEVKVVGMHCPSCAKAVELCMMDLDGVESAVVDLDANKVEVEYDNEKVSDVDLAGAVKEAGFDLE